MFYYIVGNKIVWRDALLDYKYVVDAYGCDFWIQNNILLVIYFIHFLQLLLKWESYSIQ